MFIFYAYIYIFISLVEPVARNMGDYIFKPVFF